RFGLKAAFPRGLCNTFRKRLAISAFGAKEHVDSDLQLRRRGRRRRAGGLRAREDAGEKTIQPRALRRSKRRVVGNERDVGSGRGGRDHSCSEKRSGSC